jgi:hypothetical protein
LMFHALLIAPVHAMVFPCSTLRVMLLPVSTTAGATR